MGGKRDGLNLIACVLAAGLAAAAAPPALAQAYGAREAPSDALARHLRTLADKPRDFQALIGAGKAALETGDTQAAAGFFGRAEEAWPSSPMPQIGIGAALAQGGDAAAALRYFARASQLGATASSLGVERGLAYDLLGRHAEAQADYRAAMSGSDGDEARRRLALSLAITGNKTEAIATLGPLVGRGDAAGARVRALALALTGDLTGARSAIEAAMPGSAAQMAYFFQKLPGLRSDQKAAAVHLGIFPDSSQGYSVASRPPASSSPATGGSSGGDRLASIEQLLAATREPATQPPPLAAPPPAPQRVAIANVPETIRPNPATPQRSEPATARPRVWLQLASGQNAAALPDQFKRMKSRNGDLFEGISGYVAEGPDRARLLIGPFRNSGEAQLFAEDLESVRIDAFSWTSPPGLSIRKISTE